MKRHLIGIGGVGMSALATALVRLGDEVTGADRTLGTKNIRFLESSGVKCFPDDGSGIDAVSGSSSETFYAKNKSQTLTSTLKRLTVIIAIAIAVIAVAFFVTVAIYSGM